MNPQIKERWLKALRSGEYKQGKGQLKCGDEFCCLGVLSDIYAKEHGIEWIDTHPLRSDKFLSENAAVLPDQVSNWADCEVSPSVVIEGGRVSLSALNDGVLKGLYGEHNFSSISDFIESQL